MWIDRIGVALSVLAASAYLARRVAQRVASAFMQEATSAGMCAAECGCGMAAEPEQQRASPTSPRATSHGERVRRERP
jgi:hypothetical protein